MSVDTVLYALTTVTQRIRSDNSNAFSVDSKRRVLDVADCMRSYLIVEDIKGFDWYIDTNLARNPDLADFLVGELFEELGIGIREELTNKLNEV